MNETRFANLLDLARLPYFEVRDGRLCIADARFTPAIDVHTHLALAYGPRARVDLTSAREPAEHYLPADRPIDLDVYANRNFSTEDLARLERDLTFASFGAGGMRRTHTLPNLTREMAELGIATSVLLPIDFPFWSDNARTWLRLTRGHREIVCFGSVHPYARRVRETLDELAVMGARGVKVHPSVQMVGPDDDRAMNLYRLCGERGMVVFFHCGPVGIDTRLGRRLSQVARYERAAAECPATRFVFGHSGALQMPEAIALAQRYPNVYLEVASQGVTAVRRLVDEAPPGRLMFGTDWPFYHQAAGLAKVLLATEGDDAMRADVLHRNARRLLGLAAG